MISGRLLAGFIRYMPSIGSASSVKLVERGPEVVKLGSIEELLEAPVLLAIVVWAFINLELKLMDSIAR